MFVFGHIATTVVIFKACDILGSTNGSGSSSRFRVTAHKKLLPLYRLLNRIKSQLGSIDYRLVILGSLLPDILDKPTWLFISTDFLLSGRSYGHTFLFNLLLFISALILIRYKKSWLLVISLSSFFHLVLDWMWNNPVTLWWPLLGPFQRAETAGWISNMIHYLFSNAYIYITEIIGLAVILLLGYRLLVSKNITKFIKTGGVSF